MPENEAVKPPVIVPGQVTVGSVVPVKPNASLAATLNKVQGAGVPRPKTLTTFNTNDLKSGFFHGCIYGETDARKSTTAAQFGTSANVRIILTRRPEQLIPLRKMGYEVALVEDEQALNYALMYPEQIWGQEWAKHPERTLVLDDATEAVALLIDGAGMIDGRVVKDRRRSYTEAGSDLREAIHVTLKKPQHFIMTALAKVRDNQITGEERIGPDLPPSMLNFITTELEYCFYVDKKSWKFITSSLYTSIKSVDDTGKEKIFLREIFAKNKLELEAVTKGVITQREDMKLNNIWTKIKEGKATTPVAATMPNK